MRLGTRILCLAWLAWAPLHVSATNSDPELLWVMDRLIEWLPGEYSSQPQRELEKTHGAPPDGLHHDWYRVFAPVDVPHIGEHVIYGELRVGGKDQPILPGTQVLYIISLDPEHGAVNVNGRRIKDPERFEAVHLDPEKMATLSIDPEYGGNCSFRWRKHGEQIVGRLAQPDESFIDGTCSMVSRRSGVAMTWDAEWVLNPRELWIYDNGYLEDGSLFLGREDRTHIRLTKLSHSQ